MKINLSWILYLGPNFASKRLCHKIKAFINVNFESLNRYILPPKYCLEKLDIETSI